MKTLLAALVLFALPLLAVAFDEPDSKPNDVKHQFSASLMRSKLEHSKNILQGLANEDFQEISKGAKSMKGLTVLERWFRADTPRYKAQLNAFWFANDALIQAADEKNLDAATLAYTQLMISCVNCHKQVRATEKSAKTE
jgi:cytochrome c556